MAVLSRSWHNINLPPVTVAAGATGGEVREQGGPPTGQAWLVEHASCWPYNGATLGPAHVSQPWSSIAAAGYPAALSHATLLLGPSGTKGGLNDVFGVLSVISGIEDAGAGGGCVFPITRPLLVRAGYALFVEIAVRNDSAAPITLFPNGGFQCLLFQDPAGDGIP